MSIYVYMFCEQVLNGNQQTKRLCVQIPLKAWKSGQTPMDKQTIRYKKDASPDDLPKNPEVPALKLCQFANQTLTIPRDVRAHFMNCPLFGQEWRELVKQFDKDWGTPAPEPTATGTPAQGQGQAGGAGGAPGNAAVKTEVKKEFKFEAFDWSTTFPGSAATVAKLKEKFGSELHEMVGVSGSTSFFLAPGPELYVGAKEATCIKSSDAPIVSHGAGSWLTGEKATKFQTHNPDRGIPCKLENDEFPAVFEDKVTQNIPKCCISGLC